MSVSVDWLDERRTAIVLTFRGNWTLHEFRTSAVAMDALLDGVERPIDIIADVTHSGMSPAGIVPEVERVIAPQHRHRNMQRLLYASPNLFMKLLIASARRVSPEYRDFIYETPSLDVAIAFIDQHPLVNV